MLVNPNTGETEAERTEVQAAAAAIGQDIVIIDVVAVADFATAFTTLVRRGVGALLVGTGTLTYNNLERIVTLADSNRIPAMYARNEAVQAGGLASYGSSIADAFQQAGIYVARILKGAKPVDLPVMQSTKFDLAINLKTATALGLTVPQSLLVAATELIE
jgi:putative ABC transport system substrate-binding protein